MSDDTSIRLKRDTWRSLHERKEPGTTFDELINEMIDESESE